MECHAFEMTDSMNTSIGPADHFLISVTISHPEMSRVKFTRQVAHYGATRKNMPDFKHDFHGESERNGGTKLVIISTLDFGLWSERGSI